MCPFSALIGLVQTWKRQPWEIHMGESYSPPFSQIAYRDFDAMPQDRENMEHDLTLIGLMGLEDPVRAEVRTHLHGHACKHTHTQTYCDSTRLHREESITRNHTHAQTGRGRERWEKRESILLANVAFIQSCAIDLDKSMLAGARRHCHVQDRRDRRAYGHWRQPSHSRSHCTQVWHPYRGA